MSRGLANRNPGNIRRSAVRYRGEVVPSRDEEFKEFVSMAYGYRAMFVLLDTYVVRYSLRTIDGILARYAPPSENDTQSYVRAVCAMTGMAPDEPVDSRSHSQMTAVVAAMSRVENGTAAVAGEVEAGWRLFAADRGIDVGE